MSFSTIKDKIPEWIPLPAWVRGLAARREGSVLLQTSRFDALNRRSFLYCDPVRTLCATRLDEVAEVFREVDEALTAGLHVAGYVGYECGYHFEPRVGVPHGLAEGALPLVWFGVYREPTVFDHGTGRFEGAAVSPSEEGLPLAVLPERFAEAVDLEIPEERYRGKIERIKRYIADGETYQVNFTDRVRVATDLAAEAAFGVLLEQQPVAYSALLNIAGRQVLSLSPELFFRVDEGRIVTRPMKGTMPRGLDTAEDAEAAQRLRGDEKNGAEHVMIVDLLRNDLGRICEMGSVRVEDLFSVEQYETLLQMTSTVSGRLRQGLSYYEIFKGMFPSGSITGAPKIRTMQIIRELEESPRGVYTGAIGHISPDGAATFNVAIRTLVLGGGEARMGVGGGIVADSEAEEEYRECRLKAEFLVRARREFELIETLLWDGDFFLLGMHLDRLEASAGYFGFSFDRGAVVAQLMEGAGEFESGVRYRVRMLLGKGGEVTVTSVRFAPEAPTGLVRVSAERVDSGDVFLRHKTTRREAYERGSAKARAAGLDETIFLNERGEVTEGAISNVFVRRDGRWLTPPLRCGVLPGVFRRQMLEEGAVEGVLRVEDLVGAEVFLCNSVRGMWRVRLVESSGV